MKNLCNMRESAKFLNTSINNIEYYINKGLLTPKIISSQRYFSITQLYNLSNKNTDGSNIKTPSSKLNGNVGGGGSIYEDASDHKQSSNNSGLEDINTNFLSDTDKESHKSFREIIKKHLSF